MVNREQFAEKLKSQIDRLNADLGKLESKAASMRSKLDTQIGEIRSKRDELEARLRNITAASGDAWVSLKKGADDAVRKVRNALKQARSRFF